MNKCLFVILSVLLFSIALAQPTDPAEYAHWKMNLSHGAKSTMMTGPIQNDYVAVQLDNEDADEKGCFNIGTSSLYSIRPNETLLFPYPGDPWSSHAVYQVDGSYYSYSSRPSDFPGPPTVLTSTASGHSFTIRDTIVMVPFPLTGDSIPDTTQYIHAGWMAGGVLIMQNLIPVHIYGYPFTAIDWPGIVPPESLFSPDFWATHTTSRADTTGSVLIQYIVENPDAVSHDVGIMLEMDTMIGGNDSAPLATSYGYAAVEQEFLAIDVMPSVWYAGEDDPPWGPATLVAQGWLSGLSATTPDRFLVGSWGTYNNVTWDYTPTYMDYWDSGVLIYWYPRVVAPGGTVTYATYYGLKLPEREKPIANITYPPEMTLTACPDQTIEIVCTDDLGVDTTNFAISINGNILVYPQYMSASWVGTDMTDMTFTVTPPAGFYSSGETVEVIVFTRDFFDNISDPDTLYFIADLVGPEVLSMSVADGDSLNLTDPIDFVAEDDYAGIDSASILVGIVGVLTGPHTFEVGAGAVTYNSVTGEIHFDPTGEGFSYLYDDSILVGLARCDDMVSEDWCGANHVQDNGAFFYTPDNDTLPPVVDDYSPHFAMEGTPFSISVDFIDEAGVDTCSPSWIYDGAGPYPAYMSPYLIWDDDGELDIDYAGQLDLISIDEATFTTAGIGVIPPHPGGSEIIFRVYAYDNDFGRGRIEDALPIVQSEHIIYITQMPTAELLSPPESCLTSCEDQEILIQVSCSIGIEEDSIHLYINGNFYGIDSVEINYDPISKIIQFNPPGTAPFDDGRVTVNLLPLYDEFGTPGAEYTWYFFVDVTPPVLSNASPAQSVEMDSISYNISFMLTDPGTDPLSVAGLDPNSVQVWVTNDDGTFEVTTWVSLVGDTFIVNTDSAGLTFLDNEQITVRVRAGDEIEVVAYCDHGPNILDTSWTFTMSETPCYRGPNPITPGYEDGFNDYSLFHFPDMRSSKLDKKVYVYDRFEHLVRTIDEPADEGWIWNGQDDNNVVVPQGVYIYVIVVDNKIVCNGTISVAR